MLNRINSSIRGLKSNVRGDTIVEVIIGIALLGAAMAAAYRSVGHSLQVGTDSGNRGRALGFAQQQIEQIKYAEDKGTIPAIKTQAAVGQHFCVNPSDSAIITVGGTDYCSVCTLPSGSVDKYIDPSAGSCPASDDQIYSIYLVYNAANIFSANSQWDAPNGSGTDQLVIYYKLAG